MAFFDQAHVSIPLHRVVTFLNNELLKLLLIPWSTQLVIVTQGETLTNDSLVVAQCIADVVCLLDARDRCSVVEFHTFICFVDVDGAGLGGHKIGAEDHLTEIIVIHSLHASLLLCTIHIDSLVFSVDLTINLCPCCSGCKVLMMEPFLFSCVFEHFYYFLYWLNFFFEKIVVFEFQMKF